jgi:hypothetical protein
MDVVRQYQERMIDWWEKVMKPRIDLYQSIMGTDVEFTIPGKVRIIFNFYRYWIHDLKTNTTAVWEKNNHITWYGRIEAKIGVIQICHKYRNERRDKMEKILCERVDDIKELFD